MTKRNSPREIIKLPCHVGAGESPDLPESRQISLVGAPGAGKTRFMQELISLCGDSGYTLSAMEAEYPRVAGLARPGSIDDQFDKMVSSRSYMRGDAATQIDKLSCMLVADEFDALMELKERALADNKQTRGKLTRLDRLSSLWERVFPGNKIVAKGGTISFATASGEDLIPASRLSHGERAAFYYIAGAMYARQGAVIFIDNPSLFLHPTTVNSLWNAIEELRPDCRFVYDSVDMDFVGSRMQNVCIWIKSYDAGKKGWDYEIVYNYDNISEELFADIVGTRKPVLFIEGDSIHSIDVRLYSLVFSDHTVRPLGSCNKVIESVRSFSDLKSYHHLDCHGIVDRDRRTDEEVEYLRGKNVFVPDVAEVENLFLLKDVIMTMAVVRKRNPEKIFRDVRRNVLKMFAADYDKQALQHVRHKVKKEVICKIDARFTCITAMETHLKGLVNKLRPREAYNKLRNEFANILDAGDYDAVLKVFNHKPMLSNSGLHGMLGYASVEDYISGVLNVIKGYSQEGKRLREAIRNCFAIVE